MKKVICLLLLLFIITGCNKEKVINVTIEQYCESGTPDNGKCRVINSIEADVTCPEDFPINRESKYCERVVSIVAERFFTCDGGFTLNSGKCISNETYPKDEAGKCTGDYKLYNGECKEIRYRVQGYKCPQGNLNTETNMCEFPDQKTPVVTCPEGYTVNQNNLTCETISYEEPKEREISVEEQ